MVRISSAGTPSSLLQTQETVVLAGLTAAARQAQRNVSNGPTTLYGVLVDNQQAAASNTQVWVKLYDDISNSWVPGTTKALMGFPIEAWTSADDSQESGTYQVMVSKNGVAFENGISLMVSKEAGDTATADAATEVLVELVHG